MALTDRRADAAALGATAARAVMWNYLSFATGKFLVLVTMAVLARLLTPEDFGIVGFATLAVTYLAVFKDLGLGAAIIQRRDDIDEAADTVYVLNLVLGAALTVVTLLVAPAVAGFFDEPLVVPLLRVLAFTFVLEALGAVHIVLLRRDLDFKRKLIPDTGRSLVKGAVAIGTAAAGAGVWALVWGQLAGVAASVVLSWTVVAWRPAYRVERRLVRPLLGFGMPLVVTDIQFAVWQNLDYVVVGRMLGDAALGVYTLAYRLPELLIQSIWRVVAGAAFPLFSRLQHDRELIRRGLLRTVCYTQLATVPLCLGLVITAGPAVRVMFGQQWHEAIPVLQVLAVSTLIASVGYNAGDVYKAIGRPDILAKLGGFDLVVLVPGLVIAARHGLVAVAWTHAAAALVDTAVRFVLARRFIAVTIGDIGRQIAPSLRAGAALLAAGLAASQATSSAPDVVQLVAVTLAGTAAYLGALLRWDRPVLVRLVELLGASRGLPGRRRAEVEA
jgi:PST family polysaccharide transporter